MGDGESSGSDAATHRRMAGQLFNRAWELLELAHRTPAQDREMVAASFGSRYHWSLVGEERNFAIADWQIARVLTAVGRTDMAEEYADLALRRSVDNNLGPFMIGCGHEVLARVAAARGDVEGRDNHLARADDLLSMIEDDEEREVLAADLDSLR